MAGTRSIPVKELRADAAVMESVVLHHRYASKDDLAPHRPGGSANPDKGARGWLRYFIKLHRFHSQGERSTARPIQSAAFTANESDRMALMRGSPVQVELLAREAETGAPAYLHVYPKSLATLTDCTHRDMALGWLSVRFHALADERSAQALALRSSLMEEMLYQQRVLCWIVTTPGPRLPFPETTVRPQPPEDYTTLDVLDVYRILQAHQMVNALRLGALTDLYDLPGNKEGHSRPSWTVFIASMADAMHQPSETLLNDWSLGALLAQNALVTKGQRDAMAEAKTKREAAA